MKSTGKNKGKMKNGKKSAPKAAPVDKVIALIEKLEAKVNEVVKRHNELAEQQQKLGQFVAMEFGKLGGMYQLAVNQITESIEHMDLNVLATAEVVHELFGQLTQIDYMLKNAKTDGTAVTFPTEVPQEDIASIKAGADQWFNDIVKAAFEKVQKMRAEEEEKRRLAAQTAKEEAEKAAKDKAEAQKVEEELKKAEAPDLAAMGGGQGAEVPEGADVFGG